MTKKFEVVRFSKPSAAVSFSGGALGPIFDSREEAEAWARAAMERDDKNLYEVSEAPGI